jgi:CobQ-like glutamine amidotransferase family enzyme
MTPVFTILNVFPELFNVNGDAENAAVLAARSRWAGHSARVHRLALGSAVPEESPSIVVIGSTTDAALPGAIAALADIRPAIAGWVAARIPILAVGTGLELLGASIDLPGGIIDGLGILPVRAVAAGTRVSDDLMVDSTFGRLVGYENHARDLVLDEHVAPLGSVLYGRGNGADSGFEGVVAGNVIGTHLHGPVLAKNPTIADHLLTLAIGEGYDARNVAAGRVDDMARAARNVIATRLERELQKTEAPKTEA